jgi:hypothetical protein
VLKLLSFWLAWRAARWIATLVLILGALTLLAQTVPRRGNALGQLRHAVHSAQQPLERAIERAFKR